MHAGSYVHACTCICMTSLIVFPHGWPHVLLNTSLIRVIDIPSKHSFDSYNHDNITVEGTHMGVQCYFKGYWSSCYGILSLQLLLEASHFKFNIAICDKKGKRGTMHGFGSKIDFFFITCMHVIHAWVGRLYVYMYWECQLLGTLSTKDLEGIIYVTGSGKRAHLAEATNF